ncbi:MAG TPA: SEC-C metal-binding domain-containing protein [Urbifossiella sp.]|nr:SEC-C metal-binding domain-containing protein [Urbifossiella sp.]
MPRLPAERVREGLLHPEREVRRTALRYFTEAFWRDPAVMATVIEAVKRYGRKEAFEYGFAGGNLGQSAESVRWAVGELRAVTRSDDLLFYRSSVSRLLAEADVELLAPVADEVLAAGPDPEHAARITRRLALRARSGDDLWADVDALCRDNAAVEYGSEFPWGHAADLLEALARKGEQHAPRLMELLPVEAAEDDAAGFWRECLLTRLAGEMRHEPAVPLLIEKFEADAEVLSEEALRALARINTDAVVAAALAAYRAAESHVRLYLCGVFGDIRSDAAVDAAMALAREEDDDWQKSFLIAGLVQQLSTEGNDFAREYVREWEDHEVLSVLVPACALTGQDYPELPAWRKALVRPRRPQVAPEPPPRERHGPAPLTRDDTRVGRNDSCPCGSGKKYKKCCLPKAGAGPAGL